MSRRDLLSVPVSARPAATSRAAGASNPASNGELSASATSASATSASMSSRGKPLEGSARSNLERSFGADFSSVRVHTDHPTAPQIGAAAFTVGSDVAFAPGAYAPNTPRGYQLVAHEMTHVMQNREHSASSVSETSRAGDPAETQADRISLLAAKGIVMGPGTQYARSARVNRAETWFRGEGVGVVPSSPGGSLHDLGDGLYLTDRMDIAAQYAGTRAGDNSTVGRILSGEIEPSRLGRVLDLTTDPRWKKYVKTPTFPGGPSPEKLIQGANENYSRFFNAFLKENGIRADDFDAIIGREYVRGGKQMCVRSRTALDHVRAALAPVKPPTGGRGSGGSSSGGEGEEITTHTPAKPSMRAGTPKSPPTKNLPKDAAPKPGAEVPPAKPGGAGVQKTVQAAEKAEHGVDKLEPPATRRASPPVEHEGAPALSGRQQVAGMAANMAAGVFLGIFQSAFKEKMARDLDAMPKPKIDRRSAGDMLRDPAVKATMSLLDLLSKNFTPFGKELEENQQKIVGATNIELAVVAITYKSHADFDRKIQRLNEISDRLSAYEELLATVQDNLAAVLAKETKSLETKKAADDLREFLTHGIVINWLFEQGFSVEEISQLDSNLAYISASIGITFRDAHALKDLVDKLFADERTLTSAVNQARWGEILRRVKEMSDEKDRNIQKAPKTQ